MSSDHCADCQRPIRIVRVWGWEHRDGLKIPIDYVKSPQGEYSVMGPDTAMYIKIEDRASFQGPLYTDHRRSCPKTKPIDDRPQFVKIRVECEGCKLEHAEISEPESAKKAFAKFIQEHINCRGRKAS